jgi:hypothetical protein
MRYLAQCRAHFADHAAPGARGGRPQGLLQGEDALRAFQVVKMQAPVDDFSNSPE